MLTVHHLNDSRSQRVLWLLEELGVSHDIVHYQRHPETQMAPPEMKALHQVGKGPMISENGHVMIESGAIFEYILRHHASGRLQPVGDGRDRDLFNQWLHYAEGSATVPLLLMIYARAHGFAESSLMEAGVRETARHLRFIDAQLQDREFLVGTSLTAADVMMTFIGEIAAQLVPISEYRNIIRWTHQMHARPAFQRSLARGGPYIYADRFPKAPA